MLEVFKQLTGLVISLMELAMVTLPFWLIPVIIYFVRKKQYEKSSYYDITKKPYSAMKRNKGFYGEYLTYKYLSSLEGDKRFLFNCYVPKEDGTTSLVLWGTHSGGDNHRTIMLRHILICLVDYRFCA